MSYKNKIAYPAALALSLFTACQENTYVITKAIEMETDTAKKTVHLNIITEETKTARQDTARYEAIAYTDDKTDSSITTMALFYNNVSADRVDSLNYEKNLVAATLLQSGKTTSLFQKHRATQGSHILLNALQNAENTTGKKMMTVESAGGGAYIRMALKPSR